ncbi:MAG: EAL domain-containing protein [Candidatus Dormibacteraeota bacterium]|nr:EAL domain-containing protein [Candidatus Dormibacteraeota bacterium]
MPRQKPRILLVEDRPSDAELVIQNLRRSGIDPDWARVEDEATFRARLHDGWDLILCDFSLPQFGAPEALAMLKESGLDIPFIIVSASIGEQAAVDSMKGGAADYIFKDNLARLAALVARELEAGELRRSQARLSAMVGSSLDAVISTDEGGQILSWNRQAEAMFGWTATEAIGRTVNETVMPAELQETYRAGMVHDAKGADDGERANQWLEAIAKHRDGHGFPVEMSVARIRIDGVLSSSVFVRDLTERKRLERLQKAHVAVTRAMAADASLDTVLANVLAAIGQNLDWDISQVWVVDESGQALRCRSHWFRPGLPAADFSAKLSSDRYAKGVGLVGRVWASMEPIWIEDLTATADPVLAEISRRAGNRSAALVPLVAGSQFVGVAEFFSQQPHKQEEVLLEFNTRLGELLGRATSAAALEQSESRFRGLFFDMAIGQALIALPGAVVLAANPAFCALLGYTEAELLGKSSQMFADPASRAVEAEAIQGLSPAVPHYQSETRLFRKNGTPVWVFVSVSATMSQDGHPRQLLLQAQDITKRKEAEDALQDAQSQIRHRARHDSLTELPNRLQLEEHVQALILDAPGAPISLLLLDLDHFKEVNESFGHAAGDELLRLLAPRLREFVRREDLVGRIGGDEFGIVLAGATPAIAGQIAEKLSAALERPFIIQGHKLAVEASVGITSYPDHGETADLLMQRADIAMHVAKRTRATSTIYNVSYEEAGASHLSLMAELRAAIHEDALSLHYQPQIDMKTGLVVRFEALLRWKHPSRGMVPPDQFIPFAEQTGVIQPLTDWVLTTALRQVMAWHGEGHDLSVAVNISVRNLLDPDLPERIGQLLKGVPALSRGGAQLLSLEVTEGVLMADAAQAVERLGRLRRLGIRLSIDDFGTGYSSLAYLSRLPVNEVKIDRSFIIGIAGNVDKVAIVRAALDLGHNLRLEVVAEGVEDAETWDLLGALGCDTAQGYYMARPMPAEAVLPWLLSSPYGREHQLPLQYVA